MINKDTIATLHGDGLAGGDSAVRGLDAVGQRRGGLDAEEQVLALQQVADLQAVLHRVGLQATLPLRLYIMCALR